MQNDPPEEDDETPEEIVEHLAELGLNPQDDDLSDMLDGVPTTAPHIPKNKPWKLLKRYGSILLTVEICLLIIWLLRSGYLPLPW